MKKFGVYTIINTITNKIYVGSTTKSFNKRWNDHKSMLNNNNHNNPHLQSSWNKYGVNNFKFEVLEEVLFSEHVLSTEQYWMNVLNVYKQGYNRTPVAGNSCGVKRTKAQCRAQSKLGNWKKANAVWRGSTHTEETKAIIKFKRSKQIMKPCTIEHRKNLSKSLQGNKNGIRSKIKYFNIVADNGTETLKFKDISEARIYFKLKYTGPISRVLKGIRNTFKGYKFYIMNDQNKSDKLLENPGEDNQQPI